IRGDADRTLAVDFKLRAHDQVRHLRRRRDAVAERHPCLQIQQLRRTGQNAQRHAGEDMMSGVGWPTLDSIEDRHLVNVSLLRHWAEINSGTDNLDGLTRMEQELADAFAPLADRVERIELPPAPSVDLCGNVVTSPLGKALRFTKRPEAKVGVLLSIHYDTVFGPNHSFQHTELLGGGDGAADGAEALCGPGVVDAKGGIMVMLSAVRALE